MPLLNCCSLLFSFCHVPTFMHCAPRTQIPWISWLHIITVKVTVLLYYCVSCERLFQRFGIGSDGSGYPFEKESHRFERLTGYPFETNCRLIERLGLFVRKRSVIPSGTSQAIRSRKSVIRSNSSGYPFEKNVIRSNGSSYPLKTIVSRATVQITFTRAVYYEPVKKSCKLK